MTRSGVVAASVAGSAVLVAVRGLEQDGATRPPHALRFDPATQEVSVAVTSTQQADSQFLGCSMDGDACLALSSVGDWGGYVFASRMQLPGDVGVATPANTLPGGVNAQRAPAIACGKSACLSTWVDERNAAPQWRGTWVDIASGRPRGASFELAGNVVAPTPSGALVARAGCSERRQFTLTTQLVPESGAPHEPATVEFTAPCTVLLGLSGTWGTRGGLVAAVQRDRAEVLAATVSADGAMQVRPVPHVAHDSFFIGVDVVAAGPRAWVVTSSGLAHDVTVLDLERADADVVKTHTSFESGLRMPREASGHLVRGVDDRHVSWVEFVRGAPAQGPEPERWIARHTELDEHAEVSGSAELFSTTTEWRPGERPLAVTNEEGGLGVFWTEREFPSAPYRLVFRRFDRNGAAGPARTVATGLQAPALAVAEARPGQWLTAWSRNGTELGGNLFNFGAPRSRLYARFVYEPRH